MRIGTDGIKPSEKGVAGGVAPIETDRTVNIPTDYATLQAAIDDISGSNIKRGDRIVLNIETGHQPQSGIDVRNGDYSMFIIRSADAEVTLHADYQGHFVYVENGRGPTLDTIIDMQNVAVDHSIAAQDPDSGAFARNGYFCNQGATGTITPSKGIKNCPGRSAVGAWRGSVIDCESAIITDRAFNGLEATRGGTINADGATVTGHSDRNIYCTRTGRVNFNDGVGDDGDGIGAFVRRGGSLNAKRASFTGCTNGIWCDGATVECGDGDASGCSAVGIRCHDAGQVNAEGANASDSGGRGVYAYSGGRVSFNGGTATGCASRNVEADDGGFINAENADLKGSLGSGFSGRGMLADNGSWISARGADVSNANHDGVVALAGSHICFVDGVADNCGRKAISAFQGAHISAQDATLTNAQIGPAVDCAAATVSARGSDTTGSSGDGYRVQQGGIITGTGTGTLSQTANSITADGLILDGSGT